MKQSLISVIIPVYNVEMYLERCVRSVIAQSYPNLEIILVDDGSPDRCGEICDKFIQSDSRIRVYHKTNGGLSDARNYGVRYANGEYITFIDSDDYIAPHYVEYLVGLIQKYDADISCCCMVKTEEDTALYGVNKDIPQEQLLTGKAACKELLGNLYMILVTAWGKLYKSEIVKKYPFPVGKKHEDEATTCKYYYESRRVAVGSQCLYAYWQNPNGIMHTLGLAVNQDCIWALRHRAEFFEEKHERSLAKSSWDILFYYLSNDSICNNGRCDPYLKDFKSGKTLSVKTCIKWRFYNMSPFLYYKCRYIKNKMNGIRQKMRHKKDT